jgi:hypothetical protein
MAQGAAEREWRKLSDDNKRQAIEGANAYGADCRASGRRRANAKNWLRDQGWLGYLHPGVIEPGKHVNAPRGEFFDGIRRALGEASARVREEPAPSPPPAVPRKIVVRLGTAAWRRVYDHAVSQGQADTLAVMDEQAVRSDGGIRVSAELMQKLEAQVVPS